ncbi:MAG TPA: hypothetical protein VMH87_01660 [Pseudomonadales bacterium]|nr:hypothetical protein [Pseudomonadales bacterium]
MKKLTVMAAAGAALALTTVASQAQLQISSGTTALANISANVLTLGNFGITGDSSLVGSFGGTFSINVPATALGGGFYSSTINGTQTLRIDTGAGDPNGYLTALVTLISINNSGGINTPNVQINLSNIQYTGSGDADLAYLATSTLGYLELTTQVGYNAGTQQWTTAPGGATYSGQLAPVPEANTVIAGALMLLPLGIGAVRAIRKERVA